MGELEWVMEVEAGIAEATAGLNTLGILLLHHLLPLIEIEKTGVMIWELMVAAAVLPTDEMEEEECRVVVVDTLIEEGKAGWWLPHLPLIDQVVVVDQIGDMQTNETFLYSLSVWRLSSSSMSHEI